MQNIKEIMKENPKKAQSIVFNLCQQFDEEAARESTEESESA